MALWSNFALNAPSPAPNTFTTQNITGFQAYTSTDFPSQYHTGLSVHSNTTAMQLTVGWNVDERTPTAPADMFIRANDDTGNTATWSDWSRVLVTPATSNLAANQVLFRNSSNVFVTSSSMTFDGTNFTVSGDITAFSDATLKTNVHTIANPLTIVRNLRGVNYDRIDTGEAGSGVIAQETLPHMPQLVRNNNGTLSVNYNGFSGVFIESIKALEDQIIELRAEINKLKGL